MHGLPTHVSAREANRTAVELAERSENHQRSLMRVLAVTQTLILVIGAAVPLVVVQLAILLAEHAVARKLSLPVNKGGHVSLCSSSDTGKSTVLAPAQAYL